MVVVWAGGAAVVVEISRGGMEGTVVTTRGTVGVVWMSGGGEVGGALGHCGPIP